MTHVNWLFSYIWKNSYREQVGIILIVVLSLPFYYLSLELPKYIISDALQGKAFPNGREFITIISFNYGFRLFGSEIKFDGINVDRISYLFVLSLLFLILIMINGCFKYIINMRKGALGERLLQRLRFDLFSSLLLSTPEQRQRLKPSEAASIIKDEVEPIGGFVGDAFVQPVFLGGQALTALIFILIQNALLGLVAVAMISSQVLVIPRLRREQIRLGRQRQIASRALAGKIGEVVETLDEVSNHGTAALERGQVAQRLETLFGIRYQLYGRKFAVKALNNLMAQITPFLFYTIGGYAALTGNLGIGQLVAVIAAYRDLPPPVKDLIDWDQQRLDVEAKFQQVTEQFALTVPSAQVEAVSNPFPETGVIVLQGLTAVSATGDRMLDRVSLTLPLKQHVWLSGMGEGAGCVARILGGRLTPSGGSLKIGDVSLDAISDAARGRCIAYAGSEPAIFDGTLRDNIVYGLRGHGSQADRDVGPTSEEAALGTADGELPAAQLAATLHIVGLSDVVFRYGLASKPNADDVPVLIARMAEIRAHIRKVLAARGAEDAVEPYDAAQYIHTATIGENILFGVPSNAVISGAGLAEHDLTREVLGSLGLSDDLTMVGQRIAATMLEIFSDLTPDHLLLENFSFIPAEEFPAYRERLARAEAGQIDEADRARFLGLSFLYVEPLHRLGLLDAEMEQRILLARQAFRARISQDAARIIDFYDSNEWGAVSVRENLLFGRVAQASAGVRERVDEAIRDAVTELGLDHEIARIGLAQPAGYAGRLLFPAVKTQVALARCLIKRPSLLILDNALSSLSPTEGKAILRRLRHAMKDRTLIVVARDYDSDVPMDISIVFDGARLRPTPGLQPAAAGAPIAEEGSERDDVAALRAVPIFANLDLARIKLLAFTSERTVFAAGDLLFEQGAESDAAYVVIAGAADVLIGPQESAVRVSRIEAPAIVGEMGVVTGEVRSASIRATSELTALKLRKEVFIALMEEFPDMMLSVMRLMIKRLQDNVAIVSRRELEGPARD
ncbi:cyclic nucleotide-binding domain-containing protein [Bosea sp. F3-2]|uniref:cyclic nucleotide-binding domain-containing protein n=1 Tax=Bosea sp. F3-2 TaxID=2599640 RepID=UPI0011EC7147|nr:cyclic nucleotide-binding domain-containing protein [Bosea sp. F3-2]QEL25224.1 cyclic nucleotide-binding domain-containing protein [Bosea sp. F3-2]